jgi:CRP-like cAMP-binding protein
MAEAILETDPANAEALRYAEQCQAVLQKMYVSRLGGLNRIPTVATSAEQMRWLSLDHRAGFVLSLIDGTCTFDEILDMSGMRRLDALRILFDLLQQNVISVA